MFNKLQKNWSYLFLTPLFLTALCTAFVKHNGINISNPETLLSYFLLFLFGLVPGILMVFGGTVLRLVTVSGLLILFLLSQIKALPILPWGLKYRYIGPVFLISLSAFLYCLREKLDTLLLIMFGVFWAGAFFTTKIPLLTVQQFQPYHKQNNSELVPYIEIVLDEHIGIQGGSNLEKNDNYFSKDLINDYVRQGFTVYGQAYSRDFQTLSSFASFLNFKPIDNLDDYIVTEKNINSITQNKLFELLSDQGYEINVLQSTFVNLCMPSARSNLKKCSTYNYAEPLPYPVVHVKDKSIAILNNIFSGVPLLENLSHKLLATLFSNNTKQTIVEAPTATYRIFPEALKLAKGVEKGNAYFIHLLMPHYPYVFDAHCKYLGDRGKSVATYMEQVKCTHKMVDDFLKELAKNPAAQNSTIVIHGDHGLRMPKPSAKKSYSFTKDSVIRTYNTFFAVKSSHELGGYNNILLPIDDLLKNSVTGKIPAFYNPKKQFVYLRSDKHTDKAFDMGIFLMPQIYGKKLSL